jgi:hypothetical protein
VTNQEKGLFLLELARKYLSDSEITVDDKGVGEVKSAGPAETWLMHASKGRVPSWVCQATGVSDKKRLKELFGTVAVFTRGGKLPPKIGV